MLVSIKSKKPQIWLIALLLISLFAYWFFDKYRYYDFHIANCSTPAGIELIGYFSADNPTTRGTPYHLRFAVSESNSNINAGTASVQLLFQPDSKDGKALEINEKIDALLIQGKKVFLIGAINIEYADYHLKMVIKQPSSDRNIVECTVRKNYSEDIRFRPWDILLSV